jgi:uncharacterized protein
LSGLTLQLLKQTYAVCRLEQGASLPGSITAGEFYSITATPEEISLVCPEEAVPPGGCCEKGWRCLRVAGPLNFSLTGILASLASPLAAAEISIFAVSTYNTDYILVKAGDLTRAVAVLGNAGHAVRDASKSNL